MGLKASCALLLAIFILLARATAGQRTVRSQAPVCEAAVRDTAECTQKRAEDTVERLKHLKIEAETIIRDLRLAIGEAEAALQRTPVTPSTGNRLDTQAVLFKKDETALLDSFQRSFAEQGTVSPYSKELERTLARKVPLWPEHFSFLSAIRTDDKVLCSTFVQRTLTSPPRFIAVGDNSGGIYIFTPSGRLAGEHHATPLATKLPKESIFAAIQWALISVAVTALVSHQPRSNLTVLLVGLRNGELQRLLVHQNIQRSQIGTEEARIEEIQLANVFRQEGGDGLAHPDSAIEHIALVPAGGARIEYVVAHADSRLAFWGQDGALRRSARIEERIRLLAVAGKTLLIVHARGTALWSLVDVPGQEPQPPLARSCEGLGEREILAAAMQPPKGAGQKRLFGLSSDGQLITFGAQIFAECKVLNLANAGLPVEPGMSLAAIPGALLLGAPSFVAAYNTSGAVSRHGPVGVVAASLASIALTAGLMGGAVELPVLQAAPSGLTVVAVGDRLVASFQSTMNRRDRTPPPPLLAWARPVIVVIVALVAVWHFGTKSQGQPFPTRRPPDLALDRNPFARPTRSDASGLQQRGVPGRRGTGHAFGGANAVRELATQLDAAGMAERRQAPRGEGSIQQMAEQIESALSARRRSRNDGSQEPEARSPKRDAPSYSQQ